MARDGQVIFDAPMAQFMTSWDLLYRRLTDAFPTERYHQGHRLVRAEHNASGVMAQFANGKRLAADLVGADGAGSTLRGQLLPDVLSAYAGYVGWRGVLDERAVPPQLARVFADAFTFFHGPRTQILCYLIPGERGSVRPGERRLNWVWYVNVPAGDALASLLTDRRDGAARTPCRQCAVRRPDRATARSRPAAAAGPLRAARHVDRPPLHPDHPTWPSRAWCSGGSASPVTRRLYLARTRQRAPPKR